MILSRSVNSASLFFIDWTCFRRLSIASEMGRRLQTERGDRKMGDGNPHAKWDSDVKLVDEPSPSGHIILSLGWSRKEEAAALLSHDSRHHTAAAIQLSAAIKRSPSCGPLDGSQHFIQHSPVPPQAV